MDDQFRGTGRTTGLMLKAISEALLNRCTWAEFADQDVPSTDAAICLEVLEMICIQLGLRFMQTRTRGNRVWIISLAPTIDTPGSAPKHPECPPLPNGR